MNSQQYNRANKRVFLAVIIVFAYIAFTLFAAVGTKDADITRISIQLVAAIAVIVIAVIAFITKRDSRTGALILVSAMTAGYFIIALINSTIGTWTYALPLVIAAMIYLDIKDDDGDERSNNHIQCHQACNAAWNRGYSSSE